MNVTPNNDFMPERVIKTISLISLIFFLPIFTSLSFAQKIEIPLQDWKIQYYGTISIQHDPELGRDVLTTNDKYAYMVNPSTTGSLGLTQQYLTVKVKTNSYLSLYVRVKDTAGKEYYIYYYPYDGTSGAYGSYVYVPIGSDFINGKWNTLVRNIRNDLYDTCGVQLKEIMYFYAYGNFRLTDLILYDALPLSVNITSPADGAQSQSLLVNVSGSVGEGVEKVTVNREEAQVTSGTFNAAEIPLTARRTFIDAIATNSAGDVGLSRIRVDIADTLPDPLTLPYKGWRTYYGGGEKTVERDSVLNKDVLKFSSASQYGGAAIYGAFGAGLGINKKFLDCSIRGDDSYTFYACVKASEGWNYYLSYSYDGKEDASWHRIVKDLASELRQRYDKTFVSVSWFYVYYKGSVWLDSVKLRENLPPAVEITSPADNSTSEALLVDVSGTVVDGVESVAVNDIIAEMSGNTFLARGVPLTSSQTMITAVSIDQANPMTEFAYLVLRSLITRFFINSLYLSIYIIILIVSYLIVKTIA